MKLLILAPLAYLTTACISAARPVQRLETGDVMLGGGLHAPGTISDPEVSAWVRYAPITYFDVTVGGMVSLPLKGHVAYGGLGELRAHVPIDPFDIVLGGSAEVGRYVVELERATSWRFTLDPRLVLTVWRTKPFIGPKISFMTNFAVEKNEMFRFVEINEEGRGSWFAGLSVGAEYAMRSGWTLGGSFDAGVMYNRGDDGSKVSVFAFNFYFGVSTVAPSE